MNQLSLLKCNKQGEILVWYTQIDQFYLVEVEQLNFYGV